MQCLITITNKWILPIQDLTIFALSPNKSAVYNYPDEIRLFPSLIPNAFQWLLLSINLRPTYVQFNQILPILSYTQVNLWYA